MAVWVLGDVAHSGPTPPRRALQLQPRDGTGGERGLDTTVPVLPPRVTNQI